MGGRAGGRRGKRGIGDSRPAPAATCRTTGPAAGRTPSSPWPAAAAWWRRVGRPLPPPRGRDGEVGVWPALSLG